jgi:hypothetical protein
MWKHVLFKVRFFSEEMPNVQEKVVQEQPEHSPSFG